jgi:hypothetical protein
MEGAAVVAMSSCATVATVAPEDLLNELPSLKRATVRGVRAPHKPLLLLLFGRT